MFVLSSSMKLGPAQNLRILPNALEENVPPSTDVPPDCTSGMMAPYLNMSNYGELLILAGFIRAHHSKWRYNTSPTYVHVHVFPNYKFSQISMYMFSPFVWCHLNYFILLIIISPTA